MTRRWTLDELIAGLVGQRSAGLDVPVLPVIDSRKAEAGTVFFAFVGERVDGHDYVADALARGAAAAVVERNVEVDASLVDVAQGLPPAGLRLPLLIRVPSVLGALQTSAKVWRRSLGPRIVGVTGSVGKTTTKELIVRVLGSRFRVLGSGGSYNNEIGLPLTLLKMDSDHQAGVLEMGMYVRGDIRSLADIAQPHIGVVTNVAEVHAERAGALADIAEAKRELVEALPPAPEGIAVLNYDDPYVRSMAPHTRARVFSYGLAPEADLSADEITVLGLKGLHLRLCYQGERVELATPLLGRHSVYTVLRAAAVGLVEGLTWPEILRGVQEPGPRLRLVVLAGVGGTQIVDDSYNSSPASAVAALDFLAALPGRRVAVLGDMLELGQYEEDGHLRVGARAAAVVQQLLTVGPRARLIAEAAQRAGLPASSIHTVDDSLAAIPVRRTLLQPSDVVLIKGSRSMRMEQIVAALRVAEPLPDDHTAGSQG